MKIILSLIPVLLFLGMLLSFDSLRLVNRWVLIICLLWGCVAASLSLVGNTLVSETFHLSFDTLSRYVAPFTEEILKMVILILLISRHRIGFAIDSAIYGFAVGSGFAFSENLIYLLQLGPEQSNLWLWISRGVGTAIMHGGGNRYSRYHPGQQTNRLKEALPAYPACYRGYLLHSWNLQRVFDLPDPFCPGSNHPRPIDPDYRLQIWGAEP